MPSLQINSSSTVPFCVCPSSIFSSMATFLQQNLAIIGISSKAQLDGGKASDFFFFPWEAPLSSGLGKSSELSSGPRSCLLGDRLSSAISFKLLFREDYQFFFSKLLIVYHCKQVFTAKSLRILGGEISGSESQWQRLQDSKGCCISNGEKKLEVCIEIWALNGVSRLSCWEQMEGCPPNRKQTTNPQFPLSATRVGKPSSPWVLVASLLLTQSDTS